MILESLFVVYWIIGIVLLIFNMFKFKSHKKLIKELSLVSCLGIYYLLSFIAFPLLLFIELDKLFSRIKKWIKQI